MTGTHEEAYEFFLRSEKNCCNNTTVKYLKKFKKIIRICLSNHWLDKDPFAAYKAKLDEVMPAFLTVQELQAISGKQFVSERINQVRDIFLFSCYTGGPCLCRCEKTETFGDCNRL